MMTDFNEGWKWRKLGKDGWQDVTLPHDAMLFEKRSADNPSGTNAGWYEGADYEYEKRFFIPGDYAEKCVTFEFEGVYHNAEVFLNGEKVCQRHYGYTNFFVRADGKLRYGAENVLRVIAHNADQPNSRWYSGAGIYRPVRLYVEEPVRILRGGVRLETLSCRPAVVRATVVTSTDGAVCVRIYDGETPVAETRTVTSACAAVAELFVPDAKLWSAESPSLYTVRVFFAEDVWEGTLGIRTLSCSAKEGFRVNGTRVILRGACIHHDNGILGARSYPEAEERRVRLLKACGYNAIRSAHNPCAKALLDACDRLGMYVIDEYADMWYVHKTKYDYACYLPDGWREDLQDMVDKDYNHPSVVLYSTGNEVGETSEARGIALAKEMTDYLHSLDGTRFVTCGINPWFNAMYRMGFGQYSDAKAEKQAHAKRGKKPAVGSEFFNELAGKTGAGFMKQMARLPICDRATRGAFAVMDVAGYNYGIERYRRDIKKYPDRVLLGSETFCADAYAFWEFARQNPALIGDFVWAGQDYLGEVGVGSWEYREYAPDFSHGPGWLTAGSGRLDLIGNLLGEAYYTRVAFGLDEGPHIAVVPVSHTREKHSPSAWKFSNALPSWSWNGLDGKRARVEVYSRAPVVELYLNGKRVGRKKFKKNCRFVFDIAYEGGELVAVACDRKGGQLSRSSLKTAGEETVLSVLPEETGVKKGGLAFVRLKFTDGAGTVKPLVRRKLRVRVEGGELLALGCASPYNEIGYTADETDTYYGEAMAVVRAGETPVTVHATDGDLCASAVIEVR